MSIPKRTVCALFAWVLVAFASVGVARAAITGQLSGTVSDASRKPVAGVAVTASAESGTYRTLTDANGRYAIVGIVPDTYTVSFEKRGFETRVERGVTIAADVSQTADASLVGAGLRNIARVSARSSSSAFQVKQTEDSYSVSGQSLTTVLGKDFNTDQKSLLGSLPSVTVDNKGGIFIRGGFSFQVGYQYEGIDYTEPSKSLQDQFSNVGNFDQLSGIASVQVIPGGGDATHGNTGTGLVAFQAKRGRYPHFGLLDLEAGVFPYDHQLGVEYGFATPNNRFSNYVTFTGIRKDYQYGPRATPGDLLGYGYGFDPAQIVGPLRQAILNSPVSIYRAANDQQQNAFLDNLVVKFGKNNAQSLQFFLQSQIVRQGLLYGADIGSTPFYSGTAGAAFPSYPDPGVLTTVIPSAAFRNIVPFYPSQPDAFANVGARDAIYSPFEAFKFEYSNNLDATTFLTARYYRTFNDQIEDQPTLGIYVPANGGIRSVFATEISKQLGAKNFVEVGGQFGFTRPFGSQSLSGADPLTGQNVATPFLAGPLLDFVPSKYFFGETPYKTTDNPCPTFTGVKRCSYLESFFPAGQIPRIPSALLTPTADQQNYSLFAQDTVDFSRRFRGTFGLRLDGYNFLIPDDPANPPGVAAVRHQRLYEPHVGFSQQLGTRDGLRFTYGRTLSIPLVSLVAFNLSRAPYGAFAGVPAFDNLTGKPAAFCGVAANRPCADYADQLYWLQRNSLFPTNGVSTPLRGASYTNYDLSYAHDFGHGIAAKVTPFFRRGYDIAEAAQTIVGREKGTNNPILGSNVYTNLGVQKATGVEFQATKEAEYGLSGSIAATYLNQIGNDVPGSALTAPALALGQLFRSPNFSPLQATIAASYKSRSGLRINPVVHLDIGYPVGIGTVNSLAVDGGYGLFPNTSVAFGDGNAYYYNDPQSPGTLADPNVTATRGTREGSSPGSFLSRPRSTTDLSLEYRAPGSSTTFGLSGTNVFNQLYGITTANPFYGQHIVSTGKNGGDAAPFVAAAYPRSPYVIFPNGAPLDVRFYVQVGL